MSLSIYEYDYDDADIEAMDRRERFISDRDIATLADTLVGTDDSLAIGLSEIGIDPADLSPGDLRWLRGQLARRRVYRDKNTGEWHCAVAQR